MPDAPAPLAIALQEWAAVCIALGEGRIVLTVRKGGIHERGGGFFQPEHQRFALLPTYLHQDPTRLQPPFAPLATVPDPLPGRHRIALWAEVAHVWKVTDLGTLQMLGPELPWSAAEVGKRFAYRDEPWLYALALRIHRFTVPLEIADDPAYAGCRSWIPLKRGLDLAGSSPVLPNGMFEIRMDRLNAVLDPGRPLSRGLISR